MTSKTYKAPGQTDGRAAHGALPQLVSLRQLAERFSCDRTTIARRLAAAGIRPYVFNDTRTGLKRYALAEVMEYLYQSRGPDTPPLDPL